MNIAPLSHTIACKICGNPAGFFGDVDFSRSCLSQPLPETGDAIAYYRCGHCHFLFTDAFDAWGPEEFRRYIYNDEYAAVDPEFALIRPHSCAASLEAVIAARKGSIRLLDYGGGYGEFARRMREHGFDAASYDPFFKGKLEPAEGERFELIHCREVIEHTPDPQAFARDILGFLADDGLIYLSTALQPPHIEALGLDWGYCAPRNGHISLFSRESMSLLWGGHGVKLGFFDDYNQIVWRGNPRCFSCFVKNAGPA
jgi:hypothetical protein